MIQFKAIFATEYVVLFITLLVHLVSLFGKKRERMPIIMYPIMVGITFIFGLITIYLIIPFLNWIA